MPVDTSMYSTLQVPNAMQTLGQVAGAMNNMNQARISNIDANEMQAIQPVLRDVNSYSDNLGNIDFNRLVPMVMSVAPKNGAAIIQNMSQAQQQKVSAQNAIAGQSADALQRASNVVFNMDPKSVTPDMLDQTAAAINKNFTSPAAQQATTQMFNYAKQLIAGTKPDDPLRATGLQHLGTMFLPQQTQQEINTPNTIHMSNGQQSWIQNTKPNVAGIQQNAVFPNTVNQTGTEENIKDNVNQMNTHFASLQDKAQGLQMIQALQGNVGALASKAIIGAEHDKLAYANGFLSLFGVPGATNAKDATDLLSKQLAQLHTSSQASSDAKQMLINAGQPGMHMDEKAMKESIGQVVSQIQANMAERDFLANYKYANNGAGNNVAYEQARQQFEKVGDPRAWQYMSLQPGSPEAKEFAKNLPKNDLDPKNKNGLAYKLGQLDHMEVFNGNQ